jgi:plastocyanin
MRLMITVATLLAGALAAGTPPDEKGTGTLKGSVTHGSVKKAQTLVYIDEMPGKEFAPPATNPTMDQRGKAFVPHVMPVVVGTTVDFLNSDDFEHNVFSPDGESYNLGNWGKGVKRSYAFKKPGVYVQLCKVHPEMAGYVVVVKTPYFALADEEGKFKIANVPAGTWKVKVWNERLKPKQLDASVEAKIEEGKESELEIKP